jgi:hypothetical protein
MDKVNRTYTTNQPGFESELWSDFFTNILEKCYIDAEKGGKEILTQH